MKERAAFLFVIRAVSCSIAGHYADKTPGKEKLDKRKKGEMPSLCVAAFKLNSQSLGRLHLQTPNQLPVYSDRTTRSAVLSKTTALVPAEKSRRAVSDQRLLPARLMASSPLTCLSPKRREATGASARVIRSQAEVFQAAQSNFSAGKGRPGILAQLKRLCQRQKDTRLGKEPEGLLRVKFRHAFPLGRPGTPGYGCVEPAAGEVSSSG